MRSFLVKNLRYAHNLYRVAMTIATAIWFWWFRLILNLELLIISSVKHCWNISHEKRHYLTLHVARMYNFQNFKAYNIFFLDKIFYSLLYFFIDRNSLHYFFQENSFRLYCFFSFFIRTKFEQKILDYHFTYDSQ